MFKAKTKVYLTLAMLGLVILPVIIWAKLSFRPETAGEYDSLAKCLTEKNVVMYGAYNCSHCQAQKRAFGDSWQYVTYVECSIVGLSEQAQACIDAGVNVYPTWIFGNGEKLESEVNLKQLAIKSECQEGL